MIEHIPWRGPDYGTSFSGQKLAIVGYSHYLQPHDVDDNQFSIDTVKGVLAKKWDLFFFNQIAGYFGKDLHFWNDVVFFNFLPSCIGYEEEKFHHGTSEQVAFAKDRVLRIITSEKPDKLLVFTHKGWEGFPQTNEEKLGDPTIPLGKSYPAQFRWGNYDLDDHHAIAFGLRHPQGAKPDVMRRAVSEIMGMKKGR